MLVAQITDTHIKRPGHLAYRVVDTATMLRDCVAAIAALVPAPDVVVVTGDLVDIGRPEEYELLRSILAPLKQPLFVVPGNHDERDAMRAAFADGGYLPSSGFLQYAIDEHPLRLIGLDTNVPGESGGLLCNTRLAWLERTLAQHPVMPTLILMHHPPFPTGIAHMDRIGLVGREGFASILAHNPQVELVLCGHLHRTIRASVGGRPALTCPSPAHQVALDLRREAPSRFMMEPPGFMLHHWIDGSLVSHVVPVGRFDGPYPFFEDDGKLIDS
ncbi:MAG TPA: phosphodiesterase [Burkholderiaceae bacterium]|nr:phosphodiesterase [Burkholderiaceae bacterium]